MLLEILFLWEDISCEPLNSYSCFKAPRTFSNLRNYLQADMA